MKNPYLNLLQICWRFGGQYRLKFMVTYCMFIVANSIHNLEPLVLGLLLNVLQTGTATWMQAFAYLLLYAALTPLFWMLHGPARVRERDVSFFIAKNWRERLFDIVAHLPLKWHQDHHSGSTISKINRSGKALFDFSNDGFQYIDTIVKFFFSFVAILWIFPWAILPILIIGGLTIGMMFYFDRTLVKLYDAENEGEHSLNASVFDYVSNIVTVISLRLEELAKKEVVRKIMAMWPFHRQEYRINETKWFLISMVVAAIHLVVPGIYLYQALTQHQPLLLGTLLMLYQYTEKFAGVFYDLAWKYEQIVVANTTVMTAELILRSEQEIVRQASLADLLPKNWQTITIQNLSFHHDLTGQREARVKDVHLILERGKKIALIGESGGGKSTTMTLLRGLYDADTAEVIVDGQSFSSLKVLGGTTTLIPQDPEIFENTIEYNITVGIQHRKKEVAQAAELACFMPVVERLAKGFETDIREKGVNLSGGEKQRLALARGIFSAQDSSILLLDEPTSSVDGRTEKKIFENLFRHFHDRCIVASIHRLHLLKLFDYIYVLDHGELVEEGTYAELEQKTNGHLKKMLEHYYSAAQKNN